MRFRLSFTHEIEGTVTVSEPEGLTQAIIGLTRHPELKTLVKEFKTSLRLYGSNGTQDGKRDWFKNIERTYGPDAVVEILIEYAPDDFIFQELFTGEVGIQTVMEELAFDHGLELTPVQNGFWRKAMSRWDVPVNIHSATNLDGESVTVYTAENLLLPTQILEKRRYNYFKYALNQYYGIAGQMEDNGFEYLQLGFETGDENILDEIKWNDIPTAMTNEPFPVATMQENGDYDFDIKVTLGHNRIIDPNFSQSTIGKYVVYIRINGNTPTLLTATDVTYGLDVVTEWVYQDTLSLLAGDEIYIYVKDDYDFSTDIVFVFGINGFEFSGSFQYGESFISIIGRTTFPQTNCPGVLIHDVSASTLDRITEPDLFYSELLGSASTRARTYDDDGCYWNNILVKGLHLRGYSLSEKQFSISMKDIWEGLNPHIPLCIGYEKHPDTDADIIRLEEIDHAYQSSSMSVLLSGVQRIKRKYSDQYFNSVETGSAKGKIEDISGIDDPQKQVRANIFKNIGRKLTLLSAFITQSLTVEWTRRSTKEKSADNKFDNDTFMVEVTADGSDYTPRLDEDYDSVTDLLNESTRYNKRWWPARAFVRWSKYIFNGCQNYVGTVYRFVSGDGNYNATSERVAGSCSDNYGGASLDEGGDIAVTSDYLYIPIAHEIEHYLTEEEFNTIDQNRNLAIGVSQFYTTGSHKEFFIDDIQRELLTGQIKLIGFFKEPFDIQTVQQGGIIEQGGRSFDATFAFEFE